MQLQSRSKFVAKGFTLIELLLAMVIGLFLMAGVFTVYVNGRTAQDNTEKQTRMVDDARFAIETITSDLRSAGFFGRSSAFEYLRGVRSPNATASVKTVPNEGDELPAIVDVLAPDCGALPRWYADLERSFNASNDTNLFAGSCIGATYVPFTDVLVTKYASPDPINVASLVDNLVYVYANHEGNGEIFVGKIAPTFHDAHPKEEQRGSIHRLRTRVYYIDQDTDTLDGYPSLHRLDLDVGPKIADTMLLPGVENLQIQYGIDTNSDGSVNSWVDPDPDDINLLARVVSVQFWVTVRSREVELPEDAWVQTINLAGKSYSFNDGFRRIVMSTVVELMNKRVFETKIRG